GTYSIGGRNMARTGDRIASRFRANVFGFLFQDARLIPDLTAMQNVRLALETSRHRDRGRFDEAAAEALRRVGLGERLNHLPVELSGGEAQRVALARATVNAPNVLLADEPTGNLEPLNRDIVLDLLSAFNKSAGTVVLVTHVARTAERATNRLRLLDGSLVTIPLPPTLQSGDRIPGG